MSDENREVKPWDLLNPNQPRSDQALIDYRLEICMSCEFINKTLVKCTKCGCFMKLKTTLKSAGCPIGKW